MNIGQLATLYTSLLNDLDELEIDMFANEEEKEDKQRQMELARNELLFYDEFKELYEKSEELEDLDVTLLYPYKAIKDENDNIIYVSKNSEEYKDHIKKYLEDLEKLFLDNKVSKEEYEKLKEEIMNLADKQMDKIVEEEKEKEEELDLDEEYETIMDNIKETRDTIVYNHIGENYYGILENKYKNMTEIERKEVLYNTNTEICVSMDVTSNITFTKYDVDTKDCVNRDGYCIMTKDVKGSQYPLEVMLFEQISKVYMKEIYNNSEYTPMQKERLALRVANNIDRQKQMIIENYKKKQLDIYNS